MIHSPHFLSNASQGCTSVAHCAVLAGQRPASYTCQLFLYIAKPTLFFSNQFYLSFFFLHSFLTHLNDSSKAIILSYVVFFKKGGLSNTQILNLVSNCDEFQILTNKTVWRICDLMLYKYKIYFI